MELDALKEIYNVYIEKISVVMEDAGAFDGFWGWGDDPKKIPATWSFMKVYRTFFPA